MQYLLTFCRSNMSLRRTRRLDLGLPLPGPYPSILLPCHVTDTCFQPEMIESFGVEKKSVAKWAGITSAVFSLSQCLTAVIWGRASDKFGRKPTILIALTCTAIASNLWGMATNLPVAILARAFAGACNGNGETLNLNRWIELNFLVGIIRTMVAEMVPEKELQPRAFSIMPLVWTIGSIFGPSFGGFFAKPVENLPALFKNSRFFEKYPFELPNLVASVLFLIGISTGVLFLRVRFHPIQCLATSPCIAILINVLIISRKLLRQNGTRPTTAAR